MEDARRWADKYQNRKSILKIAAEEGIDPGTVSAWLHKIGIEVKQGRHFVKQLPLAYSQDLVELISAGPKEVAKLLRARVWGIQFSRKGFEQLSKLHRFVRLHEEGRGVEEIAEAIGVHRSTVLQWRSGTNQPYLVKTANAILPKVVPAGWRLIPRSLESGGNEFKNWSLVPLVIGSYQDIQKVVHQVKPTNEALGRAAYFGISLKQFQSMKAELFAYLLGIMLGDAGKHGGVQERFTSMNLDLQLTAKEVSNERLGEFVCMCANSVGIAMSRTRDKQPSGASRKSIEPAPAYRWISSRSVLVAWMFQVGLGLKLGELTSKKAVRVDWIFVMPPKFRKRFVQGLADSDGTSRRHVVEVASMPNAELVTKLLAGLGMKSAHNLFEKGAPVRSCVSNAEASALPIFNEFVKGYRYLRLMRYRSGFSQDAQSDCCG